MHQNIPLSISNSSASANVSAALAGDYVGTSDGQRLSQQSDAQVRLTVVSVNQGRVQLQATPQSAPIEIDAKQLKGLGSTQLKTGDVLQMLGQTSNKTYFVLLTRQNEANASSQINSAVPKLSVSQLQTAVGAKSTAIPAQALNNLSLPTLAQLDVGNQHPERSSLISSLLQIVAKQSAALPSVQLSANIELLNPLKQPASSTIATIARLHLHLANANTFKVDLPLTNELRDQIQSIRSLSSNTTLNVEVNKAGVKLLSNNSRANNQLPSSVVEQLNKQMGKLPQQAQLKLRDSLVAELPKQTSTANQSLLANLSKTELNQLSATNQLVSKLVASANETVAANGNSLNQLSLALSWKKNASTALLSLLKRPQILTLAQQHIATQQIKPIVTNEHGAQSSVPLIAAKDTGSVPAKEPAHTLLQALLRTSKAPNTSPLLQTAQAKITADVSQVLPQSEPLQTQLPKLLSTLVELRKNATGTLQQQINAHIAKLSPKHSSDVTSKSNNAVPTKVELPNVEAIKADLVAPLVNTPNQISSIVNSTSGSGVVNALVGLLNMGMLAKLIAQPQANATSIADKFQLLTTFLAQPTQSKSNSSKPDNAKTKANVLRDLAKLDPDNRLLQQTSKALSSHNLQKLLAAENALQGNDLFNYSIPNPFSNQYQPINLRIARKPAEQKQNNGAISASSWHLTMNLDIGKQGQALAKVKMLQNDLNLDIYASNEQLKNKIIKFMPYLHKRLSEHGLKVSHQCYVGDTTPTSSLTQTQLVKTYV